MYVKIKKKLYCIIMYKGKNGVNFIKKIYISPW